MNRILICLLLLTACNAQPDLPDGVLPPEKMEAITWDLIRADGLLAQQLIKDSSFARAEKRIGVYQQVLDVHQVNYQTYRKSLRYYQNRPDLIKDVFTQMQEHTKELPQLKKPVVKADSV